jgi:hypothetical protein
MSCVGLSRVTVATAADKASRDSPITRCTAGHSDYVGTSTKSEEHMTYMRSTFTVALLLGMLGPGGVQVQAENPMSDKEATPAMKERLLEKTVKGDVLRIDGEQLVVRDSDGKEVRLHMDHTTKMDKVVPGDKIKAYFTEKGHVTTLQRLER